MVATATWRKVATESVIKGYPVTFDVVYAGLGSSSFSLVGDDSPVGEIVGTGYQRVPMQWSDFSTSMTNETVAVWSVAAGWPDVGALFLSDSFQGGSVIAYETFTAIVVSSGDKVAVDVGAIVLN